MFIVRSCAQISKQWFDLVRKYSKLNLLIRGGPFRDLKIDEAWSESLMKSQFLENIQKIRFDSCLHFACTKFVCALEMMNNLVELDLHWRFGLPLELIAKISKLKQVRKLSVTHGLGYFGDIGGMDNLTELNVSWNGIKGCDDTQPIKKWKNLNYLEAK